MMFFKRLICKIFGHKGIMFFREGGAYFCWSAGPYDCGCERCDYDWSKTPTGKACWEKNWRHDPRRNPNITLKDMI